MWRGDDEKRQNDCMDIYIYIQWVLLVLASYPSLMFWWNTFIMNEWKCRSFFQLVVKCRLWSNCSSTFFTITAVDITCHVWTYVALKLLTINILISVYTQTVLCFKKTETHSSHCIGKLGPSKHTHWLLFYLHAHYMYVQIESNMAAVTYVILFLCHTNAEFYML